MPTTGAATIGLPPCHQWIEGRCPAGKKYPYRLFLTGPAVIVTDRARMAERASPRRSDSGNRCQTEICSVRRPASPQPEHQRPPLSHRAGRSPSGVWLCYSFPSTQRPSFSPPNGNDRDEFYRPTDRGGWPGPKIRPGHSQLSPMKGNSAPVIRQSGPGHGGTMISIRSIYMPTLMPRPTSIMPRATAERPATSP